MKKRKLMTNGQAFGLVLLLLGLGFDGIFLFLAYLIGFDVFYQTTVGTLALIGASFLIFLGIMFLVFVPEKNEED